MAYAIAMPPPIVPAPTTAARVMSCAGVSLGMSGNLRDLAFGEEEIAERARLVREDAVGEELALTPGSGLEVHGDRGFDPVDRGEGRARAAGRPGKCRARRLTGGEAGVAVGDLVLEVARPPRRTAGPDEGGGTGNRALKQVAVDDEIDDAVGQRARGCERLALGAELEGEARPAQPGQPLRPAGAGNDPEQHFGLADLGARHGDAVMAGHRELETAAKRVAVNRGDERLGRIFERLESRVEGF